MTTRITVTCDGCGTERFIGGAYFDMEEHLSAAGFYPIADGKHLCEDCTRKVLNQQRRRDLEER